MDAMVWAFTELFLGGGTGLLDLYAEDHAAAEKRREEERKKELRIYG